MKIELTNDEVGALLYLIGTEIGWLRAKQDEEYPEADREIEYYKRLAFKLNGTDK